MDRLAFVLALALGAAAAAAPRRATQRPTWPAITLEHLSTHERFVLRPDPGGHLGARRLRGLTRFLRCHHTGQIHAIAARLPAVLYAVAHHFGDRAVEVIAGYRAPRIAREKGNPKSHHKEGRACDFRIDGVPLPTLRDYLRRSFGGIGVGYYPNAGFVHVDVGRKKRGFWTDYSSPGEKARYTEDPPADERPNRADEPSLPGPPAQAPTDERHEGQDEQD